MKKRSWAVSAVGLAAVALVARLAVGGETRYVSPSGTESDGYTNWATAAKTVEKAVNACNHGDIIWVSNGVNSASNQVAGTNARPGSSVSRAIPNRMICVYEVTVSRLRQPNGGAPQFVARVGAFQSAPAPQLADVAPQGIQVDPTRAVQVPLLADVAPQVTKVGAIQESQVLQPGVAAP